MSLHLNLDSICQTDRVFEGVNGQVFWLFVVWLLNSDNYDLVQQTTAWKPRADRSARDSNLMKDIAAGQEGKG